MQLNDTTNLDGVYQNIDFLCGTNTSTFTANDKKREVNSTYEFVQQLILQSMGSWDNNQSLVSINLVAGTRAYNFATSYLQVKKIMISFNGTNYVEAIPIDERNITSDIITETEIQASFSNDNPRYQLIGDSIKIYSGEIDTSVTAGIKVWAEVYKDVLSADADVPKLPDAFHIVLALGPSIKWAIKQDDEVLERSLRREFGRMTAQGVYDGLLGQLQVHYSNRLTAVRPGIRPKTEAYE